MAKGSKTIKIIVSKNEARELLTAGKFHFSTDGKIYRKVCKAIRESFTGYAKFLEEENAARQIVGSVRESPELKAVLFQLREQRNLLNKQYEEISIREATEVEKLTNAKLDEAGITNYRAKGWGWQRVDNA